MVDPAVGEAAADRETGMAGADDDRGGTNGCSLLRSLARRSRVFTSTVTLVGLVMTSKTADRFCDWATSALISSGVASASIL